MFSKGLRAGSAERASSITYVMSKEYDSAPTHRRPGTHLKPVLVFLLGTGARKAEAHELDWACVELKGRRVVVWQKQGNERHSDLPPRVYASLASLPYRKA